VQSSLDDCGGASTLLVFYPNGEAEIVDVENEIRGGVNKRAGV